MIPLVCLDVDGTLVGSSGAVTDAVWAACESARERGQHLALCTARGAFAVTWDMAVRLDPAGWHVFHAGGAVVHSASGDVRANSLDAEVVRRSRELAAENHWVIEFYTATDYVVESDDELAIAHAALIGVEHQVRALAELDTSADGGMVRIQFVVHNGEFPDVVAATRDLGVTVTAATSPIMAGATFVSLTRSDVSKGTGIEMIAGQLGIGMADVMMVGDGHNDVPALAAVGHPVAMANASDDARQVARHLVADVADDGVVEALALSARL